MSKGLSEAQRHVLQLAVTGGRVFYYSRSDVTLNALGRKGLAQWCSRIGEKYGRSHWWITDEGMTAGRAALASPVKGE